MAEAMSRLSTNEYHCQLHLLKQQLNLIESGRPVHIVEGLSGLGGMDGVREALDEEQKSQPSLALLNSGN